MTRGLKDEMKLTLGLSWRGETDPTNELEVGGTQTFLCKLGEVTANLHQIRTYEIQPLAHVRKREATLGKNNLQKKSIFGIFHDTHTWQAPLRLPRLMNGVIT